MSYRLDFSEASLKVIAKWKKSNPVQYGKLQKILHDILSHPREGLGHPEALRCQGGEVYSRRVTAHDRIIYEIHDAIAKILVIKVEGHYGDK